MIPQTYKLGITASALGADFRQSPRVARTLGFAGLQYDAYSTTFNLPDLPGSGRREFLRLLSAQDRQLVGLRYDLGAKGLTLGADVDRAIDRLDKAFDAAASMMAPLVCVDVGPLPAPAIVARPRPRISPDQAGLLILPSMSSAPPAPAEPAPPPPDPAFVDQLDAALAEIGQRADRYSVVLAIRSDLASFAAIERALKAASCPWFGLDLDPASVLRDEWELDEVFSKFGDWVRHVRGRDATAGPDRRTRPAVVGAGNTDWGVLLADLEACGYHGWITLDPTELTDRIGAADAGRKRLEAIGE
ncbi:MAG TPA: TIM barrel protein [Tepidisphaeraceae bacterium]|jgi:sugar phosphate isomerase/epimerase|nr:TIM barrel protein [Tepidisphaeraceae bacterium]